MLSPPFAKYLNFDKNCIFISYKFLSIKVILSANWNNTILKQISQWFRNSAIVSICHTSENHPYCCPNKQRTSIACKCACLSCARADRYAYQYNTYGTYLLALLASAFYLPPFSFLSLLWFPHNTYYYITIHTYALLPSAACRPPFSSYVLFYYFYYCS